ncbi:MAG TPA: hypothetical protein VJ184_16040 [Chryseolinea sp.]|nr:hypothetical protein [Chryseolinea sp.]
MKTSLRQTLLIAVGIFASLLASFNMFAQGAKTSPSVSPLYSINSQGDYLKTVNSINELAGKLYDAHQKFPQLMYSHVYGSNGELIGFTVTGVPYSSIADDISSNLMKLEALGNAVQKMDYAYLPESDERLNSRVSKKNALQTSIPNQGQNNTYASSSNADDVTASLD